MKVKIREALLKVGYATKPDFIIIGAQKGGTSALFHTLKNHTYTIPSAVKEVHYFDDDEWYNKKRVFEYHSFFPLPKFFHPKRKAFEATPLYIFHPEVPHRLYKFNPRLKLIITLRDPAERAFSAWTMYHHHFKSGNNTRYHDPRTFSNAISDQIENMENESFYDNKIAYVKRGIYHEQIERYFSYFPKDQLLIIDSNELKNRPDDVLKRIQDFIEIPYEKLKPINANSRRVDERDKYLDDIKFLKEFYKPHNERLFALIGERFEWD